MPRVMPAPLGNLTPAPAITPADAEPDVTWGDGGIDDWGWTTSDGEPVQRRPAVAAPSSRDKP